MIEFFLKQWRRKRGDHPPIAQRFVMAWRMGQCARLIQRGPPYDRSLRWIKG